MSNEPVITSTTVPAEQEGQFIHTQFGNACIAYEGLAYQMADKLTDGAYQGGRWQQESLSNGGFFLDYQSDEDFTVHNDGNQSTHIVNARVLSVIVNLYVSSQLSFTYPTVVALSDNYYRLRDYAFQDNSPFSESEISAIIQAID